MNLTGTEIEQIVAAVVQRLRSMNVHSAPAAPPKTKETTSTVANPQTRRIDSKLITLDSLGKELTSIQVICVPPNAVITPAVRDELRERGIRLERQAASASSNTATLHVASGLLVIASSEFRPEIPVGAEFVTGSENVTADLRRIAAHLNSGGTLAIWLTARPWSAAQISHSNSQATVAQIHQPDDLPRAIRDVRPNVLILDEARWSTSSLGTLLATWQETHK